MRGDCKRMHRMGGAEHPISCEERRVCLRVKAVYPVENEKDLVVGGGWESRVKY